ncbi:MAG: hypothetical protein CR993_03075 [Rhodobacterales bacterium]|nr:MAG: hypothetical protein CR993_03075 [Rhodobacterales bacterium]
MAFFSISDGDEGVRVVSYSASAATRAKATTLTVKIEVSDRYRLEMLMGALSELHHPTPKPTKRKKRLALPAPDDAELE